MQTPLKIAALVMLMASASNAQDVEQKILSEMELSAHPKFAGIVGGLITGAFTEPGLYAANSVMLDGAVFPPHSHIDDRMSVVVEGTMYLGTGPDIDPANEQVFPAGSIALTPAGTTHYMIARGGDVRILEIGAGPTATAFSE